MARRSGLYQGPNYFNSDLSVHKEFRIREHTIDARFSAFNFLNHAITPVHWRRHGNWTSRRLWRAPRLHALTTGLPIYSVGSRMVLIAFKTGSEPR